MSGGFSVSLEELAAAVGRLAAFDGAAQAVAAQADARVRALATTWTGQAANAYEDAHARWSNDLRAMRNAVAQLHEIAATAHGNYAAAVAANRAMWQA